MRLRHLQEGRDAPLYHGTNLISMAMIIQEDALSEGVHWGRPGEPNGPRLARSFKVSWDFAMHPETGQGGVLQLSQTKLAQRYRIVPYRDVDMHGDHWANETEEVVIAKEIRPLSRYLEVIWLSDRVVETALNDHRMVDSPEDEYLRYGAEYFGLDSSVVRRGVEILANHPLRNSNVDPALEEYFGVGYAYDVE